MRALVVGAGPSGLACAESILTHSPSVDVKVVDKKPKVGMDVRCACGVSLHMVDRVGVSIPQSCITTRLRKVRIYAPSLDCWELKGDRDYGYVLNRELFERHLAEKVEGLGGEVLTYKATPEKLDKLWGYDFIVGADGPSSAVAKWVGAPRLKPRDLHLGVQRTIVWKRRAQDLVELYFGEKVTPRGYAWIFPADGKNRVRVGLGVPLSERVNARKLLDEFIQSRVGDYREVAFVAKLIPTARWPRTGVYAGGRVLLVGDALPSTDPLTGGGIMQAMASGRAAGKAVAEGNPELYDKYIGWLRRQNSRRYRLKKVLHSFTGQDFNDLIRVLRGFKPKTMSLGKELRRAVLHLCLRKPSWGLRLLKSIL